MSRIFDALQRAGAERSGIEYPDAISVLTEVFEPKHAPAVTPEEAEPLPQLDLPAINLLAESLGRDELTSKKSGGQHVLEFPAATVSLTSLNRLVFFTEPDSLAAEKIRFLGVRLRQIQQTRAVKKVLVTSTIPEEGKTFVAANLAGVLAKRNQRVLLIEGDLRRPSLAQQFGLGKISGLGEWLQSNQSIASNIYRLDGPDFWMMPAGAPPANPLELMQSGRLSQLLDQLAPLFEWIIIDSPPLLPLADTTVWQRFADGTLLVVREGTTEKNALQRGIEVLKKSELLGVVLNGSSNSNHHNYYQRYATMQKKVK